MFGGDPVVEESIYNMIPPPVVPLPKVPVHKSKFPGTVPPSASTFGLGRSVSVKNIAGELAEKHKGHMDYRKSHATLGMPPGSFHPDPTKILGKCSKQPKVASLTSVRKSNPELLRPSVVRESRLPAVPRKEEKPIMNLVSSKNFVTANAVENILAAPKKVVQEVPDYLHKADYGKVPQYLTQIKNDIADEYDYIRRLQEEEEREMREGQVRQLTEDEKNALIEGLKAKWEKVNTDYQATTHITKMDSVGKKRRKEQYEALLMQIEKDIEKLHKRAVLVDVQS